MAGRCDLQDEIGKLAESYSLATEVGCKVFAISGTMVVSSASEATRCHLCDYVQQFPEGDERCLQSHLYGGLQAEKLGEHYIYFCPYGLVNWAVPVLRGGEMRYFLVGGPVLMHPVDDLLLKHIIDQNDALAKHRVRLQHVLARIQVTDPVRVRHLAEILLRCAEGIMAESRGELSEKQEFNSVNARIAETIHDLKNNPSASANGKRETIYPFDRETELIFRVKTGDKQAAREILNEILGFVYFHSGNQLDVVKSKAVGLLVLLARAAIEVGADLEIIFGLEYTYLASINAVTDINELSGRLIRILDRFMECAFSLKNAKNRDLIFKAMSFIRNHFSRDISLDDVASEVGLNPAYFSSLFKEEMKITYTDYLNRVRIEASKKLLKGGESLVDIAHAVGFNDQSYFSKVFKKVEGISPGRWRHQNSQRTGAGNVL